VEAIDSGTDRYNMRDSLFHIERLEATTLQSQIQQMLVSGILSGQMPAGSPVPSTRALARRLRVSRNTVMLAYQAAAADGYLQPRERSGFYVAKDIPTPVHTLSAMSGSKAQGGAVNWHSRLAMYPGWQVNITKPANWHEYPYPFIYGQTDPALFPIAEWRDCTRRAMNRKWLDSWTDDLYTDDDPMLVDQIRQRILTRRGISADNDEILVTLGAQNALHLIASLLARHDIAIAMENPGYPDLRNMLALLPGLLQYASVDNEGINISDLNDARLVFVTPSHQFPTNATMSMARRRQLLGWARQQDAVIVEDDYEFETNYIDEPTPALKSIDSDGRVLYVGSLSKSLMPGLRLGFMVGPAQFIAEARALRRLSYRHTPGNNQRVTAIFLALGRHDALIRRLHKAYSERWEIMGKALAEHFPACSQAPGFGGTSYWVEGPEGLDASQLAVRALGQGVVIEAGEIFFSNPENGRRCFRLGFSSIATERIEPGIKRLAIIARQMQAE
jgi:GntR family transcriptional regulator / MocR family aminotransferase